MDLLAVLEEAAGLLSSASGEQAMVNDASHQDGEELDFGRGTLYLNAQH